MARKQRAKAILGECPFSGEVLPDLDGSGTKSNLDLPGILLHLHAGHDSRVGRKQSISAK